MSSKVTCSSCGWSWNKSDSSKKDLYVCHQCGKDNTMKDGGWLNKFEDVPEAQNGIEGTMGGLTDKGFNYNGAWGGTMQMGGSLPGSVGFMYARTQSPAPSNGKYAKKTKASAQNGLVTGVKDFYSNYLNSPKYKERLLHSGYSDPNDIINSRLKNIQKTKVKSGPESVYDTKSSTVFIHPDEAKLYNTTKSSIIAHELSHAGGALMNETNFELNNFDIDQINKRNKLSGYMDQYVQGKAPFNLEKMHGSKPNEFKADMDVLRYRLFQDKIYDAGRQNFNQDILNKAKQKYKGDKEVERLFQRANDKDLIWLMNNIAKVNSETNDQNIQLAQNGQEMKYYQEGLDFKPKTISKDGGWLSKYDDGGIIEDPMGQWAHPGEITRIPSNQITMQGVDYPVLGISDTGDTKMMQPGEEYKFKGKSVTEIPMMQYGGKAPINLRDYNRNIDTTAKRDAINVVPQKTMTVEQAKQLKDKKDAQELARRKQAIAASNKVNEMSDFNLSNINQYLQSPTGLIKAVTSTPLQFITSLVNKEKYTPENIAIATGAIGDKARLFPNDPNSTFDNYINPFVQIGNMASELGRAPLDIQQGNYGRAALSVATPILTGVGEQYLSNAITPYLPAKGEVINELRDLKKAVFPTKPTFINPSEQELLSTVRNVGILSKTGANDASVLEKILAKGSSLTDDEFENLVGSSRSELQGKIQTLRETPTGAKKVGENQFEWDVNPNANQSLPPILDANGNPISTSGNFNLNRPARSEASRVIADARRQGRQLQNLYDQLVTQQGGRDLSPQQMNSLQTFIDENNYLMRTDPNHTLTSSDFLNRSVQDLYNFKLQPNKSFIRGLTNTINEARYLPQSYEQADALLPNLYRDETNNPAAEIIKAYRTLERAPKGSTFKSAGSLSTDSYPATLRMAEKAISNDVANLNYTGMDNLNPSGFSQAAGIPTDINLKEMNTMIDQLNKKLTKPLPYAYQEGTKIFAPQISVTRKKNGGWLNKYE